MKKGGRSNRKFYGYRNDFTVNKPIIIGNNQLIENNTSNYTIEKVGMENLIQHAKNLFPKELINAQSLVS